MNTDFAQTAELQRRTKHFAIQIIKLYRVVPSSTEARILVTQAIRSGTSVAANYRAACRGRSRQEFIAKLGTVVEEADETIFWLELLIETGLAKPSEVNGLLNESRQLLSIFSASRRTAKQSIKSRSTNQQIDKSTNLYGSLGQTEF